MRYLIRQGEGAAGIQRHHTEHAAARRKLERVIDLARHTEPAPTRKLIGYRTSEGDKQRMRAIPIQAKGVGGTIPGTQPLAALMAKERWARQTQGARTTSGPLATIPPELEVSSS